MDIIDVFKYNSYEPLLKAMIEGVTKKKSRHISLQELAKHLGYKSPRSIGMVLKGQRLPSSQMINLLAKKNGMTEKSRRYFELLVLLHKAQQKGLNSKVLNDISQEILTLKPKGRDDTLLDEKIFCDVSDWYYLVIKQLITSPDFVFNKNWIRMKLRDKVSNLEILQAINTMIYLGFIEKDEKTKTLRVVCNDTETTEDIPVSSIREHHKQMLERAKEAISEQKVPDREIISMTFKFDKKKTKEAKIFIREFIAEFEKKFECPNANSVYQLNTQFFSHLNDDL